MTLRRVGPGAIAATARWELPDVAETLRDVRENGDAGVARAASLFGDPPPLTIEAAEFQPACGRIDPGLLGAIEAAAGRIRSFAELQRASLSDASTTTGGFELSQRVTPLRRAGVYVPGGRYPLISSLLMGVIPARVAGVEWIAVCTPHVSDAMLAAAYVAGATCIYHIGGAQAIAALAYGTGTIPPVDVITGPGNRYVVAAKAAVSGICRIDGLAGPSEVTIVASCDADARLVAADLLAQAEHDADARVTLLTDAAPFADAVDAELERRLLEPTASGVARTAIAVNGCCAVLPLEEAIEVANAVAPEHLQLAGARAEAMVARVRTFGALFSGAGAAEVFGDYGAGPNHVLPTGGTARFSGGLSVFTYLVIRTVMRSTGPVDPGIIRDTSRLAKAEGLDAHRRAALARCAEAKATCW